MFSMVEKGTRKWVNKKDYPQALEDCSERQMFSGVENSVEFDFYNSFL